MCNKFNAVTITSNFINKSQASFAESLKATANKNTADAHDNNMIIKLTKIFIRVLFTTARDPFAVRVLSIFVRLLPTPLDSFVIGTSQRFTLSTATYGSTLVE